MRSSHHDLAALHRALSSIDACLVRPAQFWERGTLIFHTVMGNTYILRPLLVNPVLYSIWTKQICKGTFSSFLYGTLQSNPEVSKGKQSSCTRQVQNHGTMQVGRVSGGLWSSPWASSGLRPGWCRAHAATEARYFLHRNLQVKCRGEAC